MNGNLFARLNISKEHILNQILIRGSARTRTVKKNAYLSFIVMILNNIVGILFIPVVIGMIEPVRYGIWLTVNSVLNWFTLFDLGLGGGLRTRLAQALAREDHLLARKFISTGYAFLTVIVALIVLAFIIAQRYISWTRVFNAPKLFANELQAMMFFVVLFFLIKFILQLLSAILMAFQMTFVSSLVNFIAHLGSLLVIFVLFKFIDASLFLIGFIYTLSPLIVFAAVSIYLFVGRFKRYRPGLKFVDVSCLKPIMNLGVFEFIDKVSFIIIASATNIIISHIGSPQDVVPYNVTLRFMGLFLTVYGIATEPMTPAFTEAHTKNDEAWIKRVLRKTNHLSLAGVGLIMLLIPVAKPALEFLLRGKVEISWSIIILVAILVSNRMLSAIFGKFLTGIGKIRLIVMVTAISAAIYLPLVYFLKGSLAFGVLSVVIAQILVETPIALVKYLQTKRVLNRTATGVWSK